MPHWRDVHKTTKRCWVSAEYCALCQVQKVVNIFLMFAESPSISLVKLQTANGFLLTLIPQSPPLKNFQPTAVPSELWISPALSELPLTLWFHRGRPPLGRIVVVPYSTGFHNGFNGAQSLWMFKVWDISFKQTLIDTFPELCPRLALKNGQNARIQIDWYMDLYLTIQLQLKWAAQES